MRGLFLLLAWAAVAQSADLKMPREVPQGPTVAKAVPKAAPARKAVKGPLLSLPAEVKGKVAGFVQVPADTSCKVVRWVALDDGLEVFPAALLKDTKTAVVSSATKGRYRLLAYAAQGDEPTEPAICVVVVGDAPPGPGPDPKPPDPKPDPPGPKPTGGLRVLIVYESANLAAMPEAQSKILFSAQVRAALNAACEADGAVKGWRIFDKDVDASGDTAGWAALLARPRASVPWVVMTRGGTVVHDAALPADADAFLALLASKADKAKGAKGVKGVKR